MTLVLDHNPLSTLNELNGKLAKALERDYFTRIETDACRREMLEAVKTAKSAGISVDEIAHASGLAPEAVNNL
jgi:hypothetical protein